MNTELATFKEKVKDKELRKLKEESILRMREGVTGVECCQKVK